MAIQSQEAKNASASFALIVLIAFTHQNHLNASKLLEPIFNDMRAAFDTTLISLTHAQTPAQLSTQNARATLHRNIAIDVCVVSKSLP